MAYLTPAEMETACMDVEQFFQEAIDGCTSAYRGRNTYLFKKTEAEWVQVTLNRDPYVPKGYHLTITGPYTGQNLHNCGNRDGNTISYGVIESKENALNFARTFFK